ncbi:hypothetical protein ACOSQ3_020780 [Xanthoceras sorbifolium]
MDVPHKKVSLGVVIRDWRGRVRAALEMRLPFLIHVDCAEAYAILEGLRLAEKVGASPISFEYNVSSVIALILSTSLPRSELGLVIADVLSFDNSVSVCNFSFRPRHCNTVAHGLAKFGVSISSPFFWFDETPPYVEDLVSSKLVCSF